MVDLANGRVSKPGEVVAPPRAFSLMNERILVCQRCSLGAGCKARFRPEPARAGRKVLLVYDSRNDLRIYRTSFVAGVRTTFCKPPAVRYALATPGQVAACRELVHEYIGLVGPERLVCIGAQAWRELTGLPDPPDRRATWNGYEVEIVDRPRSSDQVFRLREFLKEQVPKARPRRRRPA